MGRSMALLTMEQCKDVMADCMADDVGLRWPEMQSWSLEEVEAYFLSGGITIPAVVQHTYIDDRQPMSRTEAYREAYPVAEENANPLWCCGGQWQQYAAQLNPVPAAHADGAPPKMGGVPMDRRAVSMDTLPHKVGGIFMDRRAISMDALSTHADKQPVAMFASTSTAATKRRPRLLCCHGSNSNAEATRYQAILLGLDDLEPADAPCHCIFLEGPFKAGKFDSHLESDGRAWHVDGEPIEVGLRKIVSHCMREGPYDGAYGFSQGSCMLTLLCDPAVWVHCGGRLESFPPWRFLICGGGTDYLIDRAREAPALSQHALPMPSLHIMGQADPILQASQALSRRFRSPEVVTHDGGHAIPISLADPNGPVQRAVRAFVKQHAPSCCETGSL